MIPQYLTLLVPGLSSIHYIYHVSYCILPHMSSSLDSVKPLPYDYAFMNHISSMIKIFIRKNFVYFNK